MPISLNEDRTTRLLVIEGSGVFADDDFDATVTAILEHPDVAALNGVLVDLSGVTKVELSTRPIKAAAETFTNFEATQELKLAMVAPKDVAYGLARMYEMARNAADTVRVFRDRDAALRWLGQPDAKNTDLRDT